METKNQDYAPDLLFLRYAIPSMHALHQQYIYNPQLGINQETFNILEAHLEAGTNPDRTLLENIFQFAYQQLQVVAEELGKEVWDNKVIRTYFLERHNQAIKEQPCRMHHGLLSELCQVSIGTVLDTRLIQATNHIYDVKTDGKQPYVIGNFLPDARVGDKIIIHGRIAIEHYNENLHPRQLIARKM